LNIISDNERIISHLRTIKVCLLLITLYYGVRVGVEFYYLRNLMEEHRDWASHHSSFSLEATTLATEVKSHELLKLALAHEKSQPQDGYGYWFEGLARYMQQDWKNSIQAFNHSIELTPPFEQTARPYIDKAEEMQLKKATGGKQE
jgi:hypothetical protein